MNDQQLAAVKQALEALEMVAARTGARWALEQDYAGHLEAITALQSIISQNALDWMAKNARELGLDYEPALMQQPATLDEMHAIGNGIMYGEQPAPVQEPVAHPVISGALFDFMGWLTSRNERLVLSSADNASPAVEAITEFAKMRGLSLDGARVQDWQDATPPAPQSAPVKCWCHKCNEHNTINGLPFSMTQMILCPECGNKRCPKASDHQLDCTGSNEPNQPGSVYTAPQPVPVQEPVAIVVAAEYEDGSTAGHRLEWRGRNEANDFPEGTEFYTAPQPVPVKTYHDGKPWPVAPKPWVELTKDDVESWDLPVNPTVFEFAQFIEAKLREKNGGAA